LDALSEEECWALLAGHSLGRLGFTAHSGLPVILPVNYALDGRDVLVRSGPGPKLGAAERGDTVAFEVDQVDLESRSGWSVVLTGRAHVVSPASQAERRALALEPWPAGPRSALLRIRVQHVSGRRLQPVLPHAAVR
jgi:nitroimidazol reductase NimA-like FMN-containing flavoprotein (pyridoxamine 5'-phosphate oxidase superfamily)